MTQLEQLAVLADNGTPLHLTTKLLQHNLYTVHAQDRGSFNRGHYPARLTFEQTLAQELRHYPEAVTINGDEIPRTPFPNLATVRLTHHAQHSTDCPTTQTLSLHPDQPPISEHHDAFIAGVLVHTLPPTNTTSYLTPGDSVFPHWQPLHIATLLPVSVVTPDEFHHLTIAERHLLLDRNLILPLTHTVLLREQQQIKFTKAHPFTPKPHDGDVHHYAVAHPTEGSQPFSRGEPIIVHRTPIRIDPQGLSNPEFTSITEALYTTDQDLVPVDPKDDLQYAHTLTDIQLLIDPPPTNRLDSPIPQPVNSITLSIGLDKRPIDRTLSLHLWMTQDPDTRDPQHVFYTPGATLPSPLDDVLIRAYWADNEYADNQSLGDLTFNMRCLAKAITGEPLNAFIEQLQDHLDRFSTILPLPPTPCAVTSQDGTLTFSFNPAQTDDRAT